MHSRRKVLLLAIGVSLASASVSAAQVPTPGHSAQGASACRTADSIAVDRVADRFHQILSTGDTTGLNALLGSDLRVVEGGSVENRQEYLSHHLAADIEFAKAVKEGRTSISYTCEGDVAWLISTSTSTGSFRGREINSAAAESMILTQTRDGWKIRAIHWSSARRQPR